MQPLSVRARDLTKVSGSNRPLLITTGIQWSIVFASVPAYLGAQAMRADVCWTSNLIWLFGFFNVAVILISGRTIEQLERSAKQSRKFVSNLQSVVLGAIVLAPWGTQLLYFLLREGLGCSFPGEPFELLAIASLQNAALSGAMIVRTSRGARLVLSINFFVALFSVIIASGTRVEIWVSILAALYGLIATWWWMGDYWQRLQRRFIGQTDSTRLSMRTGHFAIIATILFLLGLVGVWAAPETRSLGGFLPTSGGDRTSDPTARSGIGDGDMLVEAQDDAFSFGPVESNLFIEDQQPSLYDMMSELNGDVIKKNRYETAVGVDGAKTKINHQKLADSAGNSREFSTVRHAPKKTGRKPSNQKSDALIYYIGPSPQRLSLETYECFDGLTWTHREKDTIFEPNVFQKTSDRTGKPWIVLDDSIVKGLDKCTWTAAIKWIRLNSPRVPTPDQLFSIHIDRIDRPEFFAWTDDDILQMPDREQVPAFTTARLLSQQRCVHVLRNAEIFAEKSVTVLSDRQSVSSTNDQPMPGDFYAIVADSSLVQQTAREWTRGIPRGWEQIDAIEQRLRSDFQLDEKATVNADATDSVAHFLTHRRGPAYLFATTAAMLVRSIGYPSRIANGLYIDPASYDSKTKQHVIGKEHFHWWPQVTIDGKQWISLEPTPTYLLPEETLSWTQWSEACVIQTWRWITQNWLLMVGLACILLSVYRYRIRLFDLTLTLWSEFLGKLSNELRVTSSLWLLEQRARLAGCPRPRFRTSRQWLPQLVAANKVEIEAIHMLLGLDERRRFSPTRNAGPFFADDRLTLAFRVIRSKWTVSNISQSKPSIFDNSSI